MSNILIKRTNNGHKRILKPNHYNHIVGEFSNYRVDPYYLYTKHRHLKHYK